MDENKNEVKTYEAVFVAMVHAENIHEAGIKALEILNSLHPSFISVDVYEYFP